jgi:hypothetical protein
MPDPASVPLLMPNQTKAFAAHGHVLHAPSLPRRFGRNDPLLTIGGLYENSTHAGFSSAKLGNI